MTSLPRVVGAPPSHFAQMTLPNGGPLLILNPADDREFLAWTRRIVGDVVTVPAELETMLRGRYPAAVVRRRGLSDERGDVWYVYRDGRWVPRPPSAGGDVG